MGFITRRLLLVAIVALSFAGPAALGLADIASANPSTTDARPAARGNKVAKKRCKGKRCRRGRFMGHGVAVSELRKTPLPRPSGHVVVRNAAFGDMVDVEIYNEDGSYDQEALAKLDRVMRCRRTGEERAADPRLYEVMSLLYDRYARTINLNSGFRYQRNEGSRHFHASAMDVHIEGVSFRDIYDFAQTLDRGGMGIGQYPFSGFVHIDFRAPGEPSYRWTDTSRGPRGDPGKLPSRMWKKGKPTS